MHFVRVINRLLLLNQRILCVKRELHDTTRDVRVRFAPSPTGYLHLGGLRTALYNYLFARKHNGKFVLRIEDTDQTRLVPGAMEALIEDLLWAGIEIDEGPGSSTQTHSSYIQSQRTHIYNEAVQRLLDNNTAYRCFCTERRLDLLRKEAARSRQVPRYDNKCRLLTKAKIEELVDKKVPYCIRFKLTEYLEPFNDIIYGPVQHNVMAAEGDPVIMKSDQYPTYHFANVVDDHLMGITHVLRGVEWQISTTKHLLLYKAFNWQPPEFGHLPLLVNADGSKLSKRQGDIGIKYFRDKGYFPEALINYVVSAGGGFERPQQEQEVHKSQKVQIFSIRDLAKQFNIKRVNVHPSRLSPEFLDDLNRQRIIDSLDDHNELKQLILYIQQAVQSRYPNEKNLDLSSDHIENVLKWSTNRLTFINDLLTSNLSFLWVKPSVNQLKDLNESHLHTLLDALKSTEEFSKEHLNVILRDFANTNHLKFPTLMKSLRALLSGLKEGPGVAEMMEILGKDTVMQRIQDALKQQGDSNQSRQSPQKTKTKI